MDRRSSLTKHKSVGDIFLNMLGLASVIEKFVWGESGPEEVDKQDGTDDKSEKQLRGRDAKSSLFSSIIAEV